MKDEDAEDRARNVALLEAWRSGDSVAGERLFNRHADAVARFFVNKVRLGAEDLVHTTFLRMLQSRGTRFHQQSNGHFAIGSMTTTGILAQMGLLPGDVILAINGEPMTDLDTIAATTVDLFLGSTVTSGFTLTIGRGREVIATSVHVR